MKTIPIAVGAVVTLYWLLAFSVVFGHFYGRDSDYTPWWDIKFIRESGYWLLMIVFEVFEDLFSTTDDYIFGDSLPFFITALIFTAVFIGSAFWFFSYLLLSKTVEWSHQYK